MVFVGDRFFPLDEHDERIDVTRDVFEAFDRFHEPSRMRPIHSRSSSEEGYGEYRLTTHAAAAHDFQNIFDFYVNLPGTERSHLLPQYVWKPVAWKVTVEKLFEFHTQIIRSLGDVVSSNELVQNGFVVSEAHGRVDEFTTWSRFKWILGTDRSFVFVDYYSVEIH